MIQVRVAEVVLGDFCFKERFIIAPVSHPLLCLGRLCKAGFEVRKRNNQLELGCDAHSVAVDFKRNSLAVQGSIRMLEHVSGASPSDPVCDQRVHVRAVVLKPVLERVPHDGSLVQIGTNVYARCGYSTTFINTTLLPLRDLPWRRTTLVKRPGKEWDLIEFCEDISYMENFEGDLPNPQDIELVLTIAHDHVVAPEELGFDYRSDSLPLAPRSDDAVRDARDAVGGALDAEDGLDLGGARDVPAAPGEAEPPVDERHVPLDDNEVEVDGIRLSMSSTLKALRAACGALGLTTRGSKKQCFERLRRHIQEHALIAEHEAVAAAVGDSERKPKGVAKPGEPTPQEIAEHMITHQPYRAWCSQCVAHRGRQDQHHDLDHAHTSESVVSLDFGFCKRQESEENLLTVLVIHDRQTKALHAIPTMSKGGQALSYLTTECTRFVTWLGHRDEPAIKAVVKSVEKACRQLGVKTRSVTTPVEDHEANGAVEQAWQSIRANAGVLVGQVEEQCGAEGKVIFGSQHPFYMWSLIHAAFLHNRFSVQHSLTPFERATASQYVGRLCCYGEVVLGYLRTSAKAGARWCKGVWLGKTTQNDTHIVATTQGLFLTRSVRRLVEKDRFNLDRCGEVALAPWEHGFASLGGRLIVNKRVVLPQAVAPALNPTSPRDEAGSDPPTSEPDGVNEHLSEYEPSLPGDPVEAGTQDAPLMTSRQASSRSDASMSLPGMSGGSSSGSSELVTEAAMQARSGEAAAAEVATGLSENPRAVKAPRMMQRVEFAAICQIGDQWYEHEDEEVDWAFTYKDLDDLQDYDEGFDDDGHEELDLNAIESKLIFPRTSEHEPWLSPSELSELDRLADEFELARLGNMKVLLPMGSEEGPTKRRDNPKKLSTKMVRSWREKIIVDPETKEQKPVWLRRSRYVAREFAWLSPEKEGLYSPASSSVATKVLPAMYTYLQARDGDWVLGSMDVSDAFLMVLQEEATEVSYEVPGTKEVRKFMLGRLLPGQRDGTAKWHGRLSECLRDEVSASCCVAYPSMFSCNTQHGPVFLQTHVDDIEYLGKQAAVSRVFVPAMQKHFKVAYQTLEKPGDVMMFLKRQHVLGEDGCSVVITPHPKHVERLLEILEIDPHMCNKKCPLMPGYTEVDESSALPGPQASVYRSCIGILLYLSGDMVESQNAIRFLSQKMSSPSHRDMKMLRHLAMYLGGTIHQGMLLTAQKAGEGLLGERYSSEWTLEAFSDSDWASQKGDRKSVSSGVIAIQGNVVCTSARTQRTIALSSAEAELYASAGVLSDSFLLKNILCFLLDLENLPVHLYMDSSSGKQVWQRSGVGRIRHLSCRVLWVQQAVARGDVVLHHIRGEYNPSDVNTKLLTRVRMLFLMFLLKVYDTWKHERVGEEEHAAHMEKKAIQLMIRNLKRLEPTPRVSKQMIRSILLSSAVQYSMAVDLKDDDELSTVCLAVTASGLFQSNVSWMMVFTCVIVVCSFMWWCIGKRNYKVTKDRIDVGVQAKARDDHDEYRFHAEAIMRQQKNELDEIKEWNRQLRDECRGVTDWNERLRNEAQQRRVPDGDVFISMRGRSYHSSAQCGHVRGHKTTMYSKCRDCAMRDGN